MATPGAEPAKPRDIARAFNSVLKQFLRCFDAKLDGLVAHLDVEDYNRLGGRVSKMQTAVDFMLRHNSGTDVFLTRFRKALRIAPQLESWILREDDRVFTEQVPLKQLAKYKEPLRNFWSRLGVVDRGDLWVYMKTLLKVALMVNSGEAATAADLGAAATSGAVGAVDAVEAAGGVDADDTPAPTAMEED